MLKINLLPIRQLERRHRALNEMIAAAIIFCTVVVLLGFAVVVLKSQVSRLEEENDWLAKEIRKYDSVLAEVKSLEEEKKLFQTKIDIINRLEGESLRTVHIVDDVARLLDSNRMWLTTLDQRGASLTLEGYALDNQTVAQFMDELKKSPYIASVDLTESAMKTYAEKDLKSFKMRSRITDPGASEQTEAPGTTN